MTLKKDQRGGRWILSYPSGVSYLSGLSFLNRLELRLTGSIRPSPVWIRSVNETREFSVSLTNGGLTQLWIPSDWLCGPDDHVLGRIESIIRSIDPVAKSPPETPDASARKTDRIARGILLVIMDEKDPRWRAAALPPASVLLAARAFDSGHSVRIMKMTTDMLLRIQLPDADVIALSLYEDLFDSYEKLTEHLAETTDSWVVAGGPMAILDPVSVAAHLPGIDLLLRGESDAFFPALLDRVAKIEKKRVTDHFLESLCEIDGLIYHGPNHLVMSNPGHVERPDRLGVPVSDFRCFNRADFKNGLELSTSRGCPKNCLFCSHVHGRRIRSVPLDSLNLTFMKYAEWLKEDPGFIVEFPDSGVVNISDDDILLDPDRALGIFRSIHESGLKVWGIQTSLDSLVVSDLPRVYLTELGRADRYPGGRPIIWIGTDAFSDARLKRLGKRGDTSSIERISGMLIRYGFLVCHYWILTDAESDWEEFFEELFFIRKLVKRFGSMIRILPNAATLVPYPSTPWYQCHIDRRSTGRIVVRRRLSLSAFPEFDRDLVLHERPNSPFLYALVEPRAVVPEKLLFHAFDFLNDIRSGNFDSAISRAIAALNLEVSRMDTGLDRRGKCRVVLEKTRRALFLDDTF